MIFKNLMNFFTDEYGYCDINKICKVYDCMVLEDIPEDTAITAVYKLYDNVWKNLDTNEQLDNTLEVVDYFNDIEENTLYISFVKFTNRDWLGTLTDKQLQYVLSKVYGDRNIFCDNSNTYTAQYEWLKSFAEDNPKTEYLKKELKDIDKYLEEIK